ncbi:hypothetical protein H696_02244 [Fonticula alba]|uniref:Uncharacterized protein n=1 Tax=Fonticula alba TaxID=691883 RepID=A0A058ZBK1_FONAL|nr:hypothetical protein H696_02244 [Fonticula alba]KCV71298.1 hypothetical protein H696_02244 [Fonticula alba]|eukprot:XP_009494421.1 hypothetical protein H696_02244 [Fonticula alba]
MSHIFQMATQSMTHAPDLGVYRPFSERELNNARHDIFGKLKERGPDVALSLEELSQLCPNYHLLENHPLVEILRRDEFIVTTPASADGTEPERFSFLGTHPELRTGEDLMSFMRALSPHGIMREDFRQDREAVKEAIEQGLRDGTLLSVGSIIFFNAEPGARPVNREIKEYWDGIRDASVEEVRGFLFRDRTIPYADAFSNLNDNGTPRAGEPISISLGTDSAGNRLRVPINKRRRT